MELRFNPMKRNRGGEQDLDHIIAAALRGMDRAVLEYPIRPGLIFCLDRAFTYSLNEIIVEKAIAYRDRGVVGIDIAGPIVEDFHWGDYGRLFRRARQFGHWTENGQFKRGARTIDGDFQFTPPLPKPDGLKERLGKEEEITLIPYGATLLRVTVFPKG